MDYEKKYKEAIERAKAIYYKGSYKPDTAATIAETLQNIFPELAKSEDVVIKEKIIATIHLYYGEPLEDEAKEMIAWLEKRGEQNPWSEDDEAIYYGVIETEQYMLDVVNGIKKFDVGNISIKEDCTREIDWLKSLRPQSTWKPTEQQMKVLNEVINFAADHGTMRWNDYIYNVLKGLREQLKKLRDE